MASAGHPHGHGPLQVCCSRQLRVGGSLCIGGGVCGATELPYPDHSNCGAPAISELLKRFLSFSTCQTSHSLSSPSFIFPSPSLLGAEQRHQDPPGLEWLATHLPSCGNINRPHSYHPLYLSGLCSATEKSRVLLPAAQSIGAETAFYKPPLLLPHLPPKVCIDEKRY